MGVKRGIFLKEKNMNYKNLKTRYLDKYLSLRR